MVHHVSFDTTREIRGWCRKHRISMGRWRPIGLPQILCVCEPFAQGDFAIDAYALLWFRKSGKFAGRMYRHSKGT